MTTKSGRRQYPAFLPTRNGTDRSIPAHLRAGLQASMPESSALAVLLPEYLHSTATAERGDFHLLSAGQPLIRAARLVVLIPDGDFDELELVRRVWRLALPGRLSVLFIALARDEQSAAAFHQRLTNLAFLIADPRLRVAKIILAGIAWRKALQQVGQPGDLLVCLDGLRLRNGFFRSQDLAQMAATQTPAPVLVLTGVPVEPMSRPRLPWTDVLAWSFSALTLVAFGALQVQITRQTNGWLSNLFLIISVIIEFSLIFKINTWMV